MEVPEVQLPVTMNESKIRSLLDNDDDLNLDQVTLSIF